MSECSPESDGGSPYRRADIKRERTDEAENLGALPRPRSAKMEMTPCQTPVQSPNTYGGRILNCNVIYNYIFTITSLYNCDVI